MQRKLVRRRLTPEQREKVQASMRGILARFQTPERVLVAKPVRGKDYDTETDRNEMAARVRALIPTPRDGKPGRTPSVEEIRAAFEPLVKMYVEALGTRMLAGVIDGVAGVITKPEAIESRFKEVFSKIEELKGNKGYSGGGADYFFELLDSPGKQNRYGDPYEGQAGKAIVVSNDEKSLTFGQVAGMTKLTANESPNGSRTEFTFSSPPSFILTDFGAFVEDATYGFTLSGNAATLPLPPSNFVVGFK